MVIFTRWMHGVQRGSQRRADALRTVVASAGPPAPIHPYERNFTSMPKTLESCDELHELHQRVLVEHQTLQS